ncbi:MAG: MFS transporter [Ginsengibacter sp.]
MLLLIFVLLIVILLANPVNTGLIGQMVGSTGLMTEYFMWANYGMAIGMAAAIPLVMRVKSRFRSKEIMIGSLVIMAFLSFVIATTNSPEVIVVSGLIYGMAKMFGMIEVIIPMMFIISPKGDRGKFYSIFYPLVIILAQLGGLTTSMFSLNVGWQLVHFYTAAILLVLALVCVIFMHNQRFARKMPLYQMDWLSIILFTGSLMGMAYVLAFGKQQAWFLSISITYTAISSIVLFVWLIFRQQNKKRPYLTFGFFKKSGIKVSFLLLAGLGVFMAAGYVQSVYTNAILGYNWMTNSTLGLMTIPGIVIAGFAGFHWTKNKLPLKMFIFAGFAAYILCLVTLYFMMVPGLNIESFFLPQMLNGFGMTTLFIALWIYAMDNIPQADILTSIGVILVFRTFFVTAFFSALFGWLHYKFQWQSVQNLSVFFDGSLMNNNPGIGGYGSVQLSAILAANKTLLGYIIIAGIGLLTFILFHHFGELKFKIARFKVKYSIQTRGRKKVTYVPEMVEDVAGAVS